MKEEILTLKNIEKTAQDIIKELKNKSKEKATVLAFYGDLGVGKTTITKEIAKQLGIIESVVSPTFVIMKIYKTKDKIFKNLIHIDAYRLNNDKELLHLGFKEMLNNKDNFIIIEWPERVFSCLPEDTYKISLEHKDEETRTVKWGII